MEFEADKVAFPEGLHGTVSKIRKDHSSIRHVAVWHALVRTLFAILMLLLTFT